MHALAHLQGTTVDHLIDTRTGAATCGLVVHPLARLDAPTRVTATCRGCLTAYSAAGRELVFLRALTALDRQLTASPTRERDLTGPERSEGPYLAPSTHLLSPTHHDTVVTSPAKGGFLCEAGAPSALPAAELRAPVGSGGATVRRRSDGMSRPLELRRADRRRRHQADHVVCRAVNELVDLVARAAAIGGQQPPARALVVRASR